jgi:hypothetical protein
MNRHLDKHPYTNGPFAVKNDCNLNSSRPGLDLRSLSGPLFCSPVGQWHGTDCKLFAEKALNIHRIAQEGVTLRGIGIILRCQAQSTQWEGDERRTGFAGRAQPAVLEALR